MLRQVKHYTALLQQQNYKGFYLAVLRVAISLWLLKEVCINWQSMELLYGQDAFFVPKNTILNRLPGGPEFIKDHYIWLICLYIVVIFLNILGIGRWFTALVLLVMFYLLYQMNMFFTNAGDKMARLILTYLVFADSYQYFVLLKEKTTSINARRFRNLLSNLAALSIMIQLCLAYFTLGIAKLNDPLWQHGQATYYALSMERYTGTSLNKYLVQFKWLDVLSNYAVMLFELGFPLLIWFKKLRKPLLLSGLVFHLCIYIFMMIYGFQIVFLMTYGLFLPDSFFTRLYLKAKRNLCRQSFRRTKHRLLSFKILRQSIT